MHIYRGGSVRDHLLTSYRNSFAAVVLRQLQDKGFRDGMQARSQMTPFAGAEHFTERQPVTTADCRRCLLIYAYSFAS